ncbi:MAG: ester cyclase [Gemmatimonadota bacterium]|nr:MAG: ester cyclase [Gemmatimonadota bacterium]
MRQQHRGLVVTLLGIMVGCGPSSDAQLEVNKEVVRRFVEAQNEGDIETIRELVAPNAVRHCQATPDVQVRSREDFIAFYEEYMASFANPWQTIDLLVAEGDMVAVLATFTGRQDGPMGPFPPSGKDVDGKFLVIIRLEAGMIAEWWVEWDNLTMLTQLGHFPPPESD